jgi:carbonic anhydrase/acetyltransferase-like protein (isoleucine patch superfamily)
MAHIINYVPTYCGLMLKDVASRLVYLAHIATTHRLQDPVMRHMNVKTYRNMVPMTSDAGFIAPSACITGNVVLGADTCVFYHSCIRNFNTLTATFVGDSSVIMDRVTLMGQVKVGAHSYIGPGTSLDCCEIHDNVYIGAGATICLGAIVENGAIVAAGSVVPKDVRVPAGELWAGSDAEKVGDVTAEQAHDVAHILEEQLHTAQSHRAAIKAQMDETQDLNLEWFKKVMVEMEAQEKQVSTPLSADYPVEARRFLTPRVLIRRPDLHARSSMPVNRTAPWMPKTADQGGNH